METKHNIRFFSTETKFKSLRLFCLFPNTLAKKTLTERTNVFNLKTITL